MINATYKARSASLDATAMAGMASDRLRNQAEARDESSAVENAIGQIVSPLLLQVPGASTVGGIYADCLRAGNGRGFRDTWVV